MKRFTFASAFLINCAISAKLLPILIWHSAGESCCGSEIENYSDFIKSQLGADVHIKTVRIGNTTVGDRIFSLTTHPFKQIRQVCDEISSDRLFSRGYNAIGLSQGGLFARGLLQECDGPRMRNLISLGGPQQGVFGYPQCTRRFGALCSTIQSAIEEIAYSPDVQEAAVPATYWHDPGREELYRRNSTFLAIINNERSSNRDYARRISSLRNFVLVKYANDASIIPTESSHFGYETSSGEIIGLRKSDIFMHDTLGLRSLDDRGGLHLLNSSGGHLQLNKPWFAANVVPFLKEVEE